MRTSTIQGILRAALVSGSATCVACGGKIELTPEEDASTSDATVPRHFDAGSTTPFEDAGAPPVDMPDTGIAIDSGCVPETIMDGGTCPGPSAGAIVRTCGDDSCPSACKAFFQMCKCDYGPPYSVCKNLGSGLVGCACQGTPGGRWTAGIEPRTLDEQTKGAFFAWMVWGESASIHAFEILERELEAHGAPLGLRRAARRAKCDEERHTRIGLRLAAQNGARAEIAPAPPKSEVRSLENVATENAVEACVSETWSALLTRAQAERAVDPKVRRIFGRIAEDEAGHAALGWSVAEWARQRLSRAANERIREQTRRAVDELRAGLFDPGPELKALGIPSREEQLAMLASLDRSLWSHRLE